MDADDRLVLRGHVAHLAATLLQINDERQAGRLSPEDMGLVLADTFIGALESSGCRIERALQ